jgi:hypothetical protein
MTVYRRITAADIDAIVDFAAQALRPERYPLVFSPAKVRSAVEFFAASRDSFQLAAFDDGKPVGAIAATVAEMLWFERHEAHVVMLYATQPGVGFVLMRRLLEWAGSSPMIRRVLWAQNPGADARTSMFAERCARRSGFAAGVVSMQTFVKE